jgi:ABC-2 type transport system ATP-binding protein
MICLQGISLWGIRQKLALGTCLLHRPEIVFLDEPTSGVDPLARRRFWEIIHQISSLGVSVMVSTHYMDEAEQCDRVSLMHRGFLIAVGTPAEMKKHVAEQSGHLMELTCTNPMKGFQILRQGFPNVNIYGKKLLFYTKNIDEDTKKAEALFKSGGIQMNRCREKRIIFEDVIMYYIENSGMSKGGES